MIPVDGAYFFSVFLALLASAFVLHLFRVAKEAAKMAYARYLIRRGSHVVWQGQLMPVDVAMRTGYKGK